MKKTIRFALCLIVLFSCKKETENKVEIAKSDLKNELLSHKEQFDVPGLAFGLIVDDTIRYADAHGVKSLTNKAPITSQSLFHMASVSKPFVATAIVQLVERGEMELDQKLTHYLPYFTMADERYKDITIKQMLTHTSGIPDTDDYEWENPQYDAGAAERYVREHKDMVLDFAPGESFNYSNPAFDILCDVIAKVSGSTFEDYMKKNIFEPVGMKNSTFFKPEVAKELATQPHILGDSLQIVVSDVYPYNRRHAGSSTLHSNVEDMLRWARVYLNKGQIDGNRIFNEASYEMLTTMQTPEGMGKVCLSWFSGTMNDTEFYYHSGGDTGYATFFGFIPNKKSAVVIMANSDRFWATDSAALLLKNSVFNDSLQLLGPIHFKLKDFILKEGIEKMKEVYFMEKDRKPQRHLFDGGFLDDLGYWLIDANHPEEALEVFLFNTTLEPEDSGWVDSVADGYKALDSIELAIQWYRKAIEMNPEQDFSKEKLATLLQKAAP